MKKTCSNAPSQLVDSYLTVDNRKKLSIPADWERPKTPNYDSSILHIKAQISFYISKKTVGEFLKPFILCILKVRRSRFLRRQRRRSGRKKIFSQAKQTRIIIIFWQNVFVHRRWLAAVEEVNVWQMEFGRTCNRPSEVFDRS